MNNWSIRFFIAQFVILLSGYGFISARSEGFSLDSLAEIPESLAYANAVQNHSGSFADALVTITGKEKTEVDESDAEGEEREEEEEVSSDKKHSSPANYFTSLLFNHHSLTYFFSNSIEIRWSYRYFADTISLRRIYILFQVFRI